MEMKQAVLQAKAVILGLTDAAILEALERQGDLPLMTSGLSFVLQRCGSTPGLSVSTA